MSISAKLLGLHPLPGLILVTAVFLVLSTIGFLVARRFMPGKYEPSHNNIVGYVFGTTGAVYAVLLGFAILLVWQQYEQTETSLALEAGESVAVYRNLGLYPDRESANSVRESLVYYMRSVISDEYPAMTRMERSAVTDAAFHALWTKLGGMNPRDLREQALYSQLLTDMRTLAQSRTTRLEAADDELPVTIWLALIIGAVLTVGTSLFFSADHVAAHLVLTYLLAAVVATMWYVIIGLDHPFLGWAAIKPNHYEAALVVIAQGM